MERRRVNWSELPRELLSMIGNSLDTWIDVLRFRSICNSWRSSISPLHQTDLPLPLKFPIPYSTPHGQQIFISEHTIYRLEPIHGNDNTDSSNSNSILAQLPPKACLVKVEETKSPFLVSRTVFDDSAPVPDVLNLLDFKMVKLGKSYGLSYFNRGRCMIWISKVIKYPDTEASGFSENCSIFVIYDGGKLGYVKCGDQKLTLVDGRIIDCDDIVVYGGQPYVVDKSGTVSWIENSSLKLTRFSPPLLGSRGGRKYLVESCGELYVVDRYFENDDEGKKIHGQGHSNGTRRIFTCGGGVPPGEHYKGMSPLGQGKKTIDFKVYKIEEDGGNWVQVTNLGDRAFVLSDDYSFSVSASAFDGCKGNCIYFKDQIDAFLFSFVPDDCNFFNMEDRNITKFRSPVLLGFSNQHINRRIWMLEYFNPSKEYIEYVHVVTPMNIDWVVKMNN